MYKMYKLIIMNWLMQLWKIRNPYSGDPMVSAPVLVQVQRLEQINVPAQRENESSLLILLAYPGHPWIG